MKRTIYTWGSSLNHSTQLFPNSVKLFHRGLKGIVAFPEWRFRPNKIKTKSKTKKNPTESRAQIWALLYARTGARQEQSQPGISEFPAVGSIFYTYRPSRLPWVRVRKAHYDAFLVGSLQPLGLRRGEKKDQGAHKCLQGSRGICWAGGRKQGKLQRKEKRDLKRDLTCRESSRAEPRRWILCCSKKPETFIYSP